MPSPLPPHLRPRLTERQNQVYKFIVSHRRDAGRPPTIVEICRHLGLRSPNSVHKMLVALESKGWIERTRHEARGIVVYDDEGDDASQSLYGDGPSSVFFTRTVTSDVASPPLPRNRQPILVDPKLLPRGMNLDTCLAVVVGDDGMNGDGIRKNDLVVAEETDWQDIPNETLAVVLFGDLLTVRRFTIANGLLHLRASDKTYRNEAFKPGDEAFYVVGKVQALMRKF